MICFLLHTDSSRSQLLVLWLSDYDHLRVFECNRVGPIFYGFHFYCPPFKYQSHWLARSRISNGTCGERMTASAVVSASKERALRLPVRAWITPSAIHAFIWSPSTPKFLHNSESQMTGSDNLRRVAETLSPRMWKIEFLLLNLVSPPERCPD